MTSTRDTARGSSESSPIVVDLDAERTDSSTPTTPSKPVPNEKSITPKPAATDSNNVSSNTSNTSSSSDSTSRGRLKRQSAQLAALKTQRLYGNGVPEGVEENGPKRKSSPQTLASSPMLDDPQSKRARTTPSLHKHSGNDIRAMMAGRLCNGSSEFIEPKLADPRPSYSGLPLEAFPNTKIKKDSLWPKGKKKNAKDPVISDLELQTIEKKYSQTLQTNKADTGNSDIRNKLAPKNTKKHKGKSTKANTKASEMDINLKTPKLDAEAVTGSPLRSSKRVKVISPKKSKNTTRLAPTVDSEQGNGDSEEESTNDDFCSGCGGSGVFICCESCPKSFHFVCCDPPLDSLPEENWNCRECRSKKGLKVNKEWDSIGIFGQLLNQAELINPVEFQLPKKLKDNTFLNVNSDEYGQYTDTSLKPELSYTKANGAQIKGYNYNQDLEIENLYDKHGNPYLCHRCGNSGLGRKILLHCDYCPLVWHMDCLKDPVYTPKTIGTKWKCPNHYENLLPMNLFVKRNFKDTPIIDASLHSHFMKIAQNQNLLIKYSDQPWLKKNGNLATLQEYLAYEVENFNQMNPDYNDESMKVSNTNTLDNDDDIHENFKVPDFFSNFPIANAIVGKPNSRLAKIITMTDETNENQLNSFVYRVPEELILLDFVAKAERERARPSLKKAILKDIGLYEQSHQTELAQEDEFINNVNCLKNTLQKFSISDLVRALEGEDEVIVLDSPSPEGHNGPSQNGSDENGPSQNGSGPSQNGPDLADDEVKDLLAIRSMIHSKGKDALMAFLQS